MMVITPMYNTITQGDEENTTKNEEERTTCSRLETNHETKKQKRGTLRVHFSPEVIFVSSMPQSQTLQRESNRWVLATDRWSTDGSRKDISPTFAPRRQLSDVVASSLPEFCGFDSDEEESVVVNSADWEACSVSENDNDEDSLALVGNKFEQGNRRGIDAKRREFRERTDIPFHNRLAYKRKSRKYHSPPPPSTRTHMM